MAGRKCDECDECDKCENVRMWECENVEM